MMELVISVVSVGLLAGLGGVATDNHKLALVYGTVVGFIMVSVVTIGASVIDNGLHRTLIMMISLPAAFLFFASGAIMIQSWATVSGVSYRVLVSGIVAFSNGIVYLVDLALAYFRHD